jgi:hypothetical protein
MLMDMNWGSCIHNEHLRIYRPSFILSGEIHQVLLPTVSHGGDAPLARSQWLDSFRLASGGRQRPMASKHCEGSGELYTLPLLHRKLLGVSFA